MKILSLHCDYLRFKPTKKAIKEPEELSEERKKEIEVKDPLGIFVAVEKKDECNLKKSIDSLVDNVLDLKDKVKAERVVIYPYAHLSSELSNPKFAVDVLQGAEVLLKKKKVEVFRAPFGYYKEFELKCKGHPLAELSRSFGIEIDFVEKDEKSTKIIQGDEGLLNEKERIRLLRSMTKNRTQATRGNNDLKSNVELGKELDLYIINEVVGKGLPLFTPKGTSILREMRRFIEDEELKRGYEYTQTPIMAKSDLYKISGHWQHYKKDMFVLDVFGDDYALRPMTCPFQFVLFKRKPRTYKDLPKKYAEIATLYRKEQTGELRGLTRMWQFNLADAHILCNEEQLEEEFEKVLDLIKFVMERLGIDDLWYRFSKWDPKNENNKYVDNPKAWDATQKKMKKILDKLKVNYVEAEGEAAFYGPKLDLQYKDVYGKEDTLFTVQIDFALPEKFDLTYTDKDGEVKRPMIIHRSSIGAPERVLSHLLELKQGSLPTWISPIQVKVLSFTDRNEKAAKKVLENLKAEGIRAEGDFGSSTMGDKVRNASMMKIPYIVTIGDKEEEKGTLAVKRRGEEKPKFGVKLDEFLKDLKEEIKERK